MLIHCNIVIHYRNFEEIYSVTISALYPNCKPNFIPFLVEYQIFGGYGLENGTVERRVTNAGPRNGLRLLLNIGQEDYCGVGRKYFGAGYYVQIHDPKTQPALLITPSISVGPGSDYSISLRPVTFDRKTEFLGRCLRQLSLKMYPTYDNYYQMSCWADCIVERIWKKCGCFPINFGGKEKFLAQSFGGKPEDIKICSLPQGTCMKTTSDAAFAENITEICPRCKVPCLETFYKAQVSSEKFPSNHLHQSYIAQLGIANGGDSMSGNFAVVNFYFDSMTEIIIEESQAFTFKDFVTSFGWTMSLFLGSSFITPYELIHSVLRVCVTFCKYCRKLKRAVHSMAVVHA